MLTKTGENVVKAFNRLFDEIPDEPTKRFEPCAKIDTSENESLQMYVGMADESESYKA